MAALSHILDQESSPPSDDAQAEKPYHSKRPHKKSRKGCKNCKIRKVKCDEARPTCKSCRLRKVECVYTVSPPISEAPSSPAPSSTHPSQHKHITNDDLSSDGEWQVVRSPSQSRFSDFELLEDNPPIVVAEPRFRPPSVDEVDMKLLWFYTTSTSDSFSMVGDSRRHILRDITSGIVVRYAFEAPFLMQSLFGLASLQMQSLGVEHDRRRSLMYRAKSFEGYRKAIEEGDPNQFPALLANSLLLCALSSQQFREPDTKPLYIVDWILVWRGIGLMFDIMDESVLESSGLAGLFYRPPPDLEHAELDVPNQLLFMVASIQPGDWDYEHVLAYYETLKHLASLYSNLRKGWDASMQLRILTWPTFLPKAYIELLRTKRPRALVIISYFAMFLKLTHNIWWLRDIGQRSLTDLRRHLSPEFRAFMVAPLAAQAMTDRTEICRMILDDPSWVISSSPYPAMITLEHPFVGRPGNADDTFLCHQDQPNELVLLDGNPTKL